MIVHVARQGEMIGQFDEPTFQAKVFAGEIHPDDHYWVEGFADWKSVSQYRITTKTVRMNLAPPPTASEPLADRSAVPGEKLCCNCGYVGHPRTASKWQVFSRPNMCPKCGARDIIPLDSLVAQRFLAQQ
jgi:GYF domain 2